MKSERTPAQWNNVRYAYRDTRRYAERQGYMLKGTEKIWDSSIVNIGILWVTQNARDRLAAYLDAVFPPFWRRELDIEDVAVIEAAYAKLTRRRKALPISRAVKAAQRMTRYKSSCIRRAFTVCRALYLTGRFYLGASICLMSAGTLKGARARPPIWLMNCDARGKHYAALH